MEDVSRADGCAHARRNVVSSIPHGQFQVQQRQASDCDALMTSDAEDDACTPSTLLFHLTVFLFGLQSAVYPSFFVLVPLHWYRRHVTVESSARHFALVDLERSGSDDETWTTVRRTMRALQEETTTKSWYVILVTIEGVRK